MAYMSNVLSETERRTSANFDYSISFIQLYEIAADHYSIQSLYWVHQKVNRRSHSLPILGRLQQGIKENPEGSSPTTEQSYSGCWTTSPVTWPTSWTIPPCSEKDITPHRKYSPLFLSLIYIFAAFTLLFILSLNCILPCVYLSIFVFINCILPLRLGP